MAVTKHYSKGQEGNHNVAGVTFFSDTRGDNKVLGVGVDESTRRITHVVQWAHSMPDLRKATGQETVAIIGGDALAAVRLAQPIDPNDFMDIADISRDLRAVIGKFAMGLDTGALTPEQTRARG